MTAALFLLACTPDPVAVLPPDTGQDETTPPDSGTSLPGGFVYGDPISTGANTTSFNDPLLEWVDVAMLDVETALMAGVTGYALFDLPSGTFTTDITINRQYRVDVSEEYAVLGSRTDGVRVVALSDLTLGEPAALGAVYRRDGTHEDVSVDGDVALVAWKSDGAEFLNLAEYPDLHPSGTLPTASTDAVALLGDRAVVGDGDELVLFDVSDRLSPVELSRIATRGRPADIDFDGAGVAVAMGGSGAAYFTVESDTLIHQGDLILPGASMSVALEGEYLWIAAWTETVLAWVGDGAPMVLGHERPFQSAMGIAAMSGQAALADWARAAALSREEGLAGPEVDSPDWLVFQNSTDSERLSFTNHGPLTLEVTMEEVPDGFTADPLALSLAPGAVSSITLTPTGSGGGGGMNDAELLWSSNDPDEASQTVRLGQIGDALYEPHPDFTLLGFTWPDPGLESFTLSDFLGEVVLLVYWSDY